MICTSASCGTANSDAGGVPDEPGVHRQQQDASMKVASHVPRIFLRKKNPSPSPVATCPQIMEKEFAVSA
jgi:hypothetical protein